jgi:hypothetical protein
VQNAAEIGGHIGTSTDFRLRNFAVRGRLGRHVGRIGLRRGCASIFASTDADVRAIADS